MSSKPPLMPDGAKPLEIEYTNWRGVHSRRRIYPIGIDFRSTRWHPVAQWLLKAFDFQVGAERDFAVVDFGPRVSIGGEETPPDGWIVGDAGEETIVRDPLEAEALIANGTAVRPFYEGATVAELERIRRQLVNLVESGGPQSAFAQAVLNAKELPDG